MNKRRFAPIALCVLQVVAFGSSVLAASHADDAALENFETSDRIDAGTGPVTDIGTDAESRVTILDEREDIVQT